MAKIIFVHSECESLGIEYLSAMLQAEGHDTKLVLDPKLFDTELTPCSFLKKLFSYKKIVVSGVLRHNPDLVCMSVVSDNYLWAREIAQAIKKERNVPIIFGGPHPTIVPELVLRDGNVDFVCVGEGEEALVELVEALVEKKPTADIANICSKTEKSVRINAPRCLMENLDELPFPDKDLFFSVFPPLIKGYKIAASRGCPFLCSYCVHNYYRRLYRGKGNFVRRRSVENIIEELRIAKSRYDIKMVRFFDDVFTLDPAWLREFTREYRHKINLPYFCFIHPSAVGDRTIKMLEESNCRTVFMGFGSYEAGTREKCLGRYYSNDKITHVIKTLKNSRIFLIIDFILGIPGQSMKEALRMVKFFVENRPDALSALFLRYYPKTEITEQAYRGGFLKAGDLEKITHCCFHDRIIIDESKYRIFKKLQFFVLGVQLLPRRWGRMLLKRKGYKAMPCVDANNIAVIISSCLPRLGFKRRIHTDTVSVGSYLSFHLTFGIRKIYWLIRQTMRNLFCRQNKNFVPKPETRYKRQRYCECSWKKRNV